ncbi:aspartate 4-decarboxylase [Uliginosibacterium sp. H3]|uniref:Aspartate 4-decarboxylase n=1 Tax=Uliginosibacterium silvisoli TaxID=3114758 RepID=A0ABU6K3U1_9RHOO|nr:aspartate 4-decarboxylase [Uliginosibacterium sp. H3]
MALTLKTSRKEQRALKVLSPFELKDNLIHLAKDTALISTATMLNAGRGNPNWVATEPREAFFLLGRFALGECRRIRDDKILAGMPARQGIAQRFELFLDLNRTEPGVDFLRGVLSYGVEKKGFDRDAWIHELTDSIIGDNYPVPDRMLLHVEDIVHDYLIKEMCDGRPPKGSFDLFAVEGGTAAMCYIFDSLMQNGLLKKGDSVALFLPTFTPYIEICHLERFSFNVVGIHGDAVGKDGAHTWHYTDAQLEQLADPKIKMVAVVNPSNPPSVALSAHELKRIVDIVKHKNPNLMVVTDDVYGTFVPNFRSLMAELPHNTICVYSFSKNFGCTGWRLGVIGVHEDNIYDRMIAELPEAFQKQLDKRYGPLTLEPRKISFIDRMVADSRCVALNHTAGLSLPQQVQMCFFALTHLLDEADAYKRLTVEICHRRRDLLWKGLDIPTPPADPLRAWYYVELDIMVWAEYKYGAEFVAYLTKNYEPVDFLFRIAEQSSIVLMDGGGFGGPPWSVRVSLANLNDEDYAQIGNCMRKAAEEYVEAWRTGVTLTPKGKS